MHRKAAARAVQFGESPAAARARASKHRTRRAWRVGVGAVSARVSARYTWGPPPGPPSPPQGKIAANHKEEFMREALPAQKSPYAVTVGAGKKYFWCACGRSATQPFCDG